VSFWTKITLFFIRYISSWAWPCKMLNGIPYWQDVLLAAILTLTKISVRSILRIGEYSLVALQYRRIRYIGLRVSADTDTPAAIMINSNLTWRLKHMVHVDRMWLQMRPAFLFMFRRTDCRCNTSRHQRYLAALHAAWCFNYRYARKRKTHASVSKGRATRRHAPRDAP